MLAVPAVLIRPSPRRWVMPVITTSKRWPSRVPYVVDPPDDRAEKWINAVNTLLGWGLLVWRRDEVAYIIADVKGYPSSDEIGMKGVPQKIGGNEGRKTVPEGED